MEQSRYTIVEACSQESWEFFYSLPSYIYPNTSQAIPTPSYEVRRLLSVQSNPFFQHYSLRAFIVLRNGKPASRITLHLPVASDNTTATFGFFESTNDSDACKMLFDHVRMLCRGLGIQTLEGPYNPSFRSISGIQLSGFDFPTVFTEPCSPFYYSLLLENEGFRIAKQGYTWMCDDLARFKAGSRELVHDGRYRVHHPKRSEMKRALSDLELIVGGSFNTMWGGHPLLHDGEMYAAQWLFEGWMNDSIAIVYQDDEPIGTIIVVPDILPLVARYENYPDLLRRLLIHRRIPSVERLVFYAIAMREEYRNSIAGYLLAHSFQQVASRFRAVHSSWITAGNHASERIARRFGLEPWKKFALYHTQIQPTSIHHSHITYQGEGHETTC